MYESLKDLSDLGVEVIHDFIEPDQIDLALQELDDPSRVEWLDTHEVYQNQRGLTIIQNHYTFALKLSLGDQTPLEKLPRLASLKERVQDFVIGLVDVFPSLKNWQADELTFHCYDNQEIGLSYHRDNLRFVGLIAIVSLRGECDLMVRHQNQEFALSCSPGDLCLLRAPGLIESDQEIRPEHSVQNLKSETRISMMLRANNRPHELIPGFKFNNWDLVEAN